MAPGTKEIEQSPGGLNAFLPLGGQSCPSPQNVFHEIEDGKRILREIRLLVWLFLDDCFSTNVCDHAAERPDHPDMEGFLVFFLGGGSIHEIIVFMYHQQVFFFFTSVFADGVVVFVPCWFVCRLLSMNVCVWR